MTRIKLIGGIGAAALTVAAASQWMVPPTKAVAPAPVISAPIVEVPKAPAIKPLALLPPPAPVVCEPTLVKTEPVKTVAKPRGVRQYRRIRYGYYKHRRRSYYR